MKHKPYTNVREKIVEFFIFSAMTICAMAIPSFVYKNRNPTILEVCRDTAENAINYSSVPKATEVKFLKIAANYDCRSRSIVMADRLDSQLGGVLADKGQKIIDEARKNNLCPVFLAAVAMHESANGESKCARDKNNTFGIFDSKTRRHKYFTNVDECIEFSARLLGKSKLYCGGNNYTIAAIQKIYCPVGAKNDPNSLNKYWLTGIISKMKKIWKEDSICVAVL